MQQLTQDQAGKLNRVYFKTFDTVDQHRFGAICRNTEQELRDFIAAEIADLKARKFSDEKNRQYWIDYDEFLAIVKVTETYEAI